MATPEEQAQKPAAQAPLPPVFKVYAGWAFDAAEAKRRQEETAAALRVPVEKDLDLGGRVKMPLALVPAGEFDMGSPHDEADRNDDERLHRVRITRPFYIGKCPVTQEQWQAVLGGNPSLFKGPRRPVEQVSWDDCQSFLGKANAGAGRSLLALPTEAQWEYACRAGSKGRFCFGDSEADLAKHAWYSSSAGGKTHPVGQKRPNAWGLHDTHGNVWEWCADWYGASYYAASPQDAPEGPRAGQSRVLRGGGWYFYPDEVRCACRHSLDATSRGSNLGFRVACRIQE